MKWIYGFFIVLLLARFECSDHPEVVKCEILCSQQATVKDLTGLDGCGFVLELADGSRLIPQRLVYIQPPDADEDPGYSFNFVDGQKVCFGYNEVSGADACMAGKLIFLSCIKVCANSSSND